MELKSSLDDKILKLKMLTVLITPKDRDDLVELLKSIPKKAKLDRLDDYMLNNLIQALENPEIPEPKEESLPQPEDFPEEKLKDVVIKHTDKLTIEDKIRIVGEIKRRLDPKDEKNVNDFIKESIQFGQKNFGIKTVPKSNSLEAMYDWLVVENIIFPDGRPNPNAGKGIK